jgi:hypothetical protein
VEEGVGDARLVFFAGLTFSVIPCFSFDGGGMTAFPAGKTIAPF